MFPERREGLREPTKDWGEPESCQLGGAGQGERAGLSYSPAPQPALLPAPVCFWRVPLASPNRSGKQEARTHRAVRGRQPPRAQSGVGNASGGMTAEQPTQLPTDTVKAQHAVISKVSW